MTRALLTALLAAIALGGCGSAEDAAEKNTAATADRPLSAAELAKSRADSIQSYQAFVEQPDEVISAELGKCRADIEHELSKEHLNVMLADSPGRTIKKMKQDAKDEIARLNNDPSSPGMDVVMESANLCTFDRVFGERKVQQGSAFCEFRNGRYVDHGVGALNDLPNGLAYTCDGYGL
jgi:hypothetical protein